MKPQGSIRNVSILISIPVSFTTGVKVSRLKALSQYLNTELTNLPGKTDHTLLLGELWKSSGSPAALFKMKCIDTEAWKWETFCFFSELQKPLL